MNEQAVSIIAKSYAIEPLSIFPNLTEGMGNVRDFLLVPKSKKFMGKQDITAVVALGRALKELEYDNDNTGLYMTSGFAPFVKDIIVDIASFSSENNKFSIDQFIKHAAVRLNPLLTFKCLPNMPLYHCSVNFKLKGYSYITYPAIGEYYQCLIKAIQDLRNGSVSTAIVGASADINNFIVKNRLKQIFNKKLNIADCSSFIVLELTENAVKNNRKILYNLESLELSYDPSSPEYYEKCNNEKIDTYLGPVSLNLLLNNDLPELTHEGVSFNHYIFKSYWKKQI